MEVVEKDNERIHELLALYASNEMSLYDICERVVQLENIIRSLDSFIRGEMKSEEVKTHD